MASMIQVRVDDQLKIDSDNLFKSLGTDTTTAIRIFLTQAVASNGFPFEIKRVSPMSEEELIKRLETINAFVDSDNKRMRLRKRLRRNYDLSLCIFMGQGEFVAS